MKTTKETQNVDALLASAADVLAAHDADTFKAADTSQTTIPEETETKIRAMIRERERKNWWRNLPAYGRRGIAACVACVVTLGMVWSVQAGVWGTVLEHFDKFAAVFFDTDGTLPAKIEAYKEPSIIPEGTVRRVTNQTNLDYTIWYEGDYMGKTEGLVIYRQALLVGELLVDNEDCVITPVLINGGEGQLFEYEDGKTTVIWHDSVYAYRITSYIGYIDCETVLAMAESVQ